MTTKLTNRQKRTFGNNVRINNGHGGPCKHNGQRRIRPDGCLICHDCKAVMHDPRIVPADPQNKLNE